jgi:glycyl-tRNA synthetase
MQCVPVCACLHATVAMQKAEQTLYEVEGMDCAALAKALKDWDVKSNEPGGGEISEPFPFNLMFQTSIGPSGNQTGFLRPETAQGIFVSFRDLLYYNGSKLPFAAAQIGQSFRNEINPKQGLLRVREFTQAEIEHFVHPDKKAHPRFHEVADVAPLMHSAGLQQAHAKAEPLKLGEAVAKGIVANETLGYFIGRTYLFMVSVGINPQRMQFRQHLPNEMAHYACGVQHRTSLAHSHCGTIVASPMRWCGLTVHAGGTWRSCNDSACS